MHGNRPRALDGNAAVDDEAGPALDLEHDFLGGCEVDVLADRDELDVLPGLELHFVALRLKIDVVLGSDELDAGVALACLDSAGQQADGLARMDAGSAGDGEVAVFSTGEDEGFAVGEVEVLPGDGADAGLGDLDDGGVGEVRQFAGGLGVLVPGVALGAVLVLGVDHAAGDFVQGVEGSGGGVDLALVCFLAADGAAEADGFMGGGGLIEGVGELPGLFEERTGRCDVAGGLGGGAGPGGHDDALAGA